MKWRSRLDDAKRDTFALYLASRDPRVGWPAKLFGMFVLAYALSPIDLLPDFIPVLGYLDDAILIPLGLVLFRKMIPPGVFEEHRATATERLHGGVGGWIAAATVVLLWAILALLVVFVLVR